MRKCEFVKMRSSACYMCYKKNDNKHGTLPGHQLIIKVPSADNEKSPSKPFAEMSSHCSPVSCRIASGNAPACNERRMRSEQYLVRKCKSAKCGFHRDINMVHSPSNRFWDKSSRSSDWSCPSASGSVPVRNRTRTNEIAAR